jgi:replication factor C subunit 2/4
MRFVPLSSKSIHSRLKAIAIAEHVSYGDQVYEEILSSCKGDMRRAVTLLQSCVNFHGNGGNVTPAALEEISGGVPRRLMNTLWSAVELKDFDKMTNAVDGMMLEGFPALACLVKIHDDVLASDVMSDAHKAAVCEAIAHTDKNLADGADDFLQLHNVCTRLLRL